MDRETLIRRLLSRREVSEDKPKPRKLRGRCWLWTGATQSGDGYGKIRIGERIYYTHRVSAFLWLGMPLNAPSVVRHRCIGNPACFQPLHLRQGTIAENNGDIVEQGRHSSGGVLTDSILARLVGAVRSGKLSIGKWAHLSGVKYCTAYRAYNGLTHRGKVEALHKRWDSKGAALPNPLLIPAATDLAVLNPPPGCDIDPDGMLTVVDPVAAGIFADVARYEAGITVDDGIPF